MDDLKELQLLAMLEDDGDLTLLDYVKKEIEELEEDVEEKLEVIPDILEKIDAIEKMEGPQGEQGEKGDRGEQGIPGIQGERGIPGEKGDKGEQGERGMDGLDGVDGKDGRDGVDGKDGSPDTAEQIKEKLQSLKGNERLDASAIKNLPQPVINNVTQVRGGGGLEMVRANGAVVKQGISSLDFGSSLSVTPTTNGVNIGLNTTQTEDIVGTDFIKTRSGTITRDVNGYVSVVAKTGGRTLTVTRNGDGYITSVTDGTRTYSLTRNGSNQVTSWTVS